MRQVLQDRRTGKIEVREVPAPSVRKGFVLIANGASLISSGTERAAVELGRRSLLGKALERPDLVRRVLETARSRGLREAVRAVAARLDEPGALGYSSAGAVLEVGLDVNGLSPGDPVACAGFGYASHAEIVCVPKNLVTPVPQGVPAEDAAFVAVGAIGLHGVRTAATGIGDTVLVIGLGLVGLITVQILKASGCRVLGVDLSPERCELARSLGVDEALLPDREIVPRILDATSGRGVDATIIAAASKSADPVRLAGEASRDRARVCVVGDVHLEVPRALYYAKELEVRVSRSYGPGRYDPLYEESGIPYPAGYVPWAERENMAEFLRLLARAAVRIAPLITRTYPVEQAAEAYKELMASGATRPVAIVLTYPAARRPERRLTLRDATAKQGTGAVSVSFIGAGLFARSVLLPRFKHEKAVLRGLVTAGGQSARAVADRFGFAYCATDVEAVFNDPDTSAVVIATRHDTHARLASQALRCGKHVFLEKPPALNREELEELLRAAQDSAGLLLVGFNRRFAPLALRMRESLRDDGAVAVSYRVNAGSLPAGHWVRDPKIGGGRIIGETCHFVDFLQFLTDEEPVEVSAYGLPAPDGGTPDTVVFQLRFSRGSVGAVQYLSIGNTRLPKERLEGFSARRAVVLDDFQRLETYAGGRREVRRTRRQDKGHAEEVRRFLAACREGGSLPIPLRSLALTSLVTFAVEESLRRGTPVPVEF